MGAEISRNELVSGVWNTDIDAHPENNYQFIDSATEYQCSVRRNPSSWTYCGYVQLPNSHPDFSKTYQNLSKQIEVHGGLTFSENGKFGFDTAHFGDISPARESHQAKNPDLYPPPSSMVNAHSHYWTFDEVKAEVESMAKQFKDRESGEPQEPKEEETEETIQELVSKFADAIQGISDALKSHLKE